MSTMKLKLMPAALLVGCAAALVALIAPAASTRASGHADDDAGDGGRGGLVQVAQLHELQAAFHGAVSHNGDPAQRAEHLALLETLWAPDSTLTVGGGTRVGRDAVIDWFANAAPLSHDWVSLTPLFRNEFDVHGKTADLSFTCILVDPVTEKVMGKTSFTGTARKVHGDWVFSDITITPGSL